MNPRLLPVLTLLVGAALLHAEESRWNVTAECQMITLPQKAALALLPELHDDAKFEAAFARLEAMIERKEAVLAGHLVAKAKDGEKAEANSIKEFPYATDYDLQKVAVASDPLKNTPSVSVVPKSFETRFVGTSLEITTKVYSEGRLLSVRADPRHVRLKRMTHFDAGHLPTGERLGIEQPEFANAGNSSSLLLRNGQRVLLGVHKYEDDPADTFELFILKVSAVRAP